MPTPHHDAALAHASQLCRPAHGPRGLHEPGAPSAAGIESVVSGGGGEWCKVLYGGWEDQLYPDTLVPIDGI